MPSASEINTPVEAALDNAEYLRTRVFNPAYFWCPLDADTFANGASIGISGSSDAVKSPVFAGAPRGWGSTLFGVPLPGVFYAARGAGFAENLEISFGVLAQSSDSSNPLGLLINLQRSQDAGVNWTTVAQAPALRYSATNTHTVLMTLTWAFRSTEVGNTITDETCFRLVNGSGVSIATQVGSWVKFQSLGPERDWEGWDD